MQCNRPTPIPLTSFFAPIYNHQIPSNLFKIQTQHSQEGEDAEEARNKTTVAALYKALTSNNVDVVHLLLAPYLEWWFHGPPTHQHLNRLLTGAPPYDSSFKFIPLSIVAFGSMVLVEGFDDCRSVSWVHAWTVTDGIITQIREYYNTSVTVTRLSSPEIRSQSGNCQSVWQSKLADNESVPGLVLAL
ncbi:wound-induced protein 1 [Prunus yedoensis var. nudiflora]|uniref:Wound-induced protein 1 n=1 Tax=Prunus yedoensis var. nudiflora TaxID=2094558 RepID=A0A314YU56_PRUYE|nr:wound-induced protein 1 [Prunus yedoensis var. nudiflora]